MKISNSTRLQFAFVAGRLPFPGHSLTLIVKGTFDLNPGGKPNPSEDQPFPTGDEFYPGDEDMQGGPRYESDFACFKPRADLLLVGRCHPEGGNPTQTCQATFRVGTRSKTVAVFGNRYWERRRLRWRATEAEPFTEMDLRYENSFGGEKIEKNPLGKGGHPVRDDHGTEFRPLPNIEDPACPVESPKSRPDPSGFGPLGRMWQTRHAKTGTYTGDYVETRWPWFPEDFDWTHFNAAPEDMQLEGYLRGDEELYFENLHPRYPEYESQLPGLRVRCFLNKLVAPDTEEIRFVEVPMNLDTLWVDMEAEKLVLVWRGWEEVLSEDYEEVQDVFILSEELEQQSASLEECHRQLLERKAEEEKAWAMAPEGPEGDEGGVGGEGQGGPAPPAKEGEGPGIDPAQLEAQTNALLAQLGIDPESLPPEAKEKQARLIRTITETDPDKVAEMQFQELDAQMREALAKLDLDPDNLPPLSAKAKAEQVRFMKELGIKEADVSADPELENFWAMTAAILPKMGIDPENLDPLIGHAGKQLERLKVHFGIEEEAREGPGGLEEQAPPPMTREALHERVARGESLEGACLGGLDLSGVEIKGMDCSGAMLAGTVLANAHLQDAILTNADLTGADLSGADLTGANLAGADLSGANLEKACLKDTDLTGSNLIGASLVGAVLTDALFEKARMQGALLDQVEAKDANFSEADLTGALFKNSACSRADFSKAVLDQADFRGANLREAFVEGAVGRQVNLAGADLTDLRASEGCDFTGGIFRGATGTGSIWEEADLTGSDFRGSRMEGATFTAACLKQADLSAADMRFTGFHKANLREARLVQMNLFQGSLEKADLTGADLSGSNMYGVEFLKSVIEGTRVEGANLKMSKLEKMMAET